MDKVQKGLLGAAIGGIFGGLSGSGNTQGSQGYTGGIPDLTASRTLVPGVFGSTYTTPTGELAPRTPGSSGRRYFSDVDYAPVTDAAGLPTIMGAAEFQAANQAALDRQQELTDLGTGLLDTYEQNLASQATTGTTDLTGGATTVTTGGATTDLTGGATTVTTGGATTDLTGGDTTLTGGDTTLTGGDTTLTGGDTTLTGGDTTLTGGDTTLTAYDTFANSLKGRELTTADAAAIAASGYSLNDLASTLSTATMPVTALALRNFINYYTDGSTTTDDGKVGPVGMKNLLVNELGYTENADGTLTDPTNGRIYGLSADDTWVPQAATTTTDTTGGITTTTAYDTFANSLRGRQLTAADAAAIAASGYSLNDLASTLSTATMPIDALALRNFINTYTSGSTTTDDGKVGSTGMRNLLVNELGYTENADGTLTDPTNGRIYGLSADDTWVPQAATTTDTTTTGTTTTGTTTTDAVDTLLNSTEQYMVASGGYTDNGDGTVTDNTNGYVYDNDTGEGFFPATDTTTTDTTTTDTTTTDDPNAAFNTFITPFRNQDGLTQAQLIALGNSNFDLSTIASDLEVDPTVLSSAIALARRRAATTTTDAAATGFVSNTVGDGFGEIVGDADAVGTTTTPTGTGPLTSAQLKQAVLDGTMDYNTAYRQLGIADAVNPFGFTEDEQMALGIHESQRTGQGYKQNPTTGSMDLYDYDTDTFVAEAGNTTTTDTTTTDDSNAAFNTFIAPFRNQTDGLTPAQLIALGNSNFDLSTVASNLEVDLTTLSNAIAQAQDNAEVESVINMVDPSDGFSDTEAASVAKLILDGKTGITDVANQFEDVSGMDVIEGLIRGGYESPAAMTERLTPYNTGLTEVELMASLLSQGRTTPEELAAYYGNNPDYPEYAGITAADVRGFAKDLGIAGYAGGGDINGYYLGGTTDGMADQIPATIDNNQPAALSDGEFVIPADVVSHLGNGNSDAGASNLYSMMDRVRTDRTGNPNQGRQIDPNKYLA